MMKRRHFTAQVLGSATAAAFGLAAAPTARAQAKFVEGTHYVRLAQPLAVPGDGKIDVIEFFWYGCPHCNSFEPMLDAWSKKLPPDVAFRRVPVAFREEPFVPHQRIYYALEALGLVEQMHRRVFFAIHNERLRLDKPQDIAAFMAKHGVDSAKFLDAYNSFGVQTKQRQARQLAEAYKIDGVPSIGVHGRWFTSGTLAGSLDRSLAVADHLIGLARSAKR
jgi:thiol:disulfide interchange protein DsbA